MKPITYYCDTPAIQALCETYGSRWEGMELDDLTAILITLSIAANHMLCYGQSQRLDLLAEANWNFKDVGISYALANLDGELGNLQGLLYLIGEISLSTSPKQLEQAA